MILSQSALDESRIHRQADYSRCHPPVDTKFEAMLAKDVC